MKRKQQVWTSYIYKYKALLNLDGSMHPGAHYNHTYALVVAWESIIILLYTVLHNNWETMQIDYMFDFFQAPVYRGCYMNI